MVSISSRNIGWTSLVAGEDPIPIAKHTRHKSIDMIVRYANELRLLEGTNWSEVIFGDSAPHGQGT